MDSFDTRVMAYKSIAVAEANAGYKDEAQDTFQMVLSAAFEAENLELRRFTIPTIALGQAEAGFFDGALTKARTTPDEQKKDALKWIAVVQAQAGHSEEARSTFRGALLQITSIRDQV